MVTNDKFVLTMADYYHDGTSMGLIPVIIGSQNEEGECLEPSKRHNDAQQPQWDQSDQYT